MIIFLKHQMMNSKKHSIFLTWYDHFLHFPSKIFQKIPIINFLYHNQGTFQYQGA
jgi:hypothetical protein